MDRRVSSIMCSGLAAGAVALAGPVRSADVPTGPVDKAAPRAGQSAATADRPTAARHHPVR